MVSRIYFVCGLLLILCTSCNQKRSIKALVNDNSSYATALVRINEIGSEGELKVTVLQIWINKHEAFELNGDTLQYRVKSKQEFIHWWSVANFSAITDNVCNYCKERLSVESIEPDWLIKITKEVDLERLTVGQFKILTFNKLADTYFYYSIHDYSQRLSKRLGQVKYECVTLNFNLPRK